MAKTAAEKAAEKAEKDRLKAIKTAEAKQLAMLKNSQALELKALKAEAKEDGLSAKEISALVKAETAANKMELTTGKGLLSSSGLQQLPALVTQPTFDTSQGWGADVAQRISSTVGLMTQYGISPGRGIEDGSTGMYMTQIDKALQTYKETGAFPKGTVGKTLGLVTAAQNGTLTADQLKDFKIKPIKGQDGVFKVQIGDRSGDNQDYSTTYLQQNPDGSYKIAGVDKYQYEAPDEDGGLFGNKLLNYAAIGAAGVFGGPLVAQALGGGVLGAAGAGAALGGIVAPSINQGKLAFDAKGALIGGAAGGLLQYGDAQGWFDPVKNAWSDFIGNPISAEQAMGELPVDQVAALNPPSDGGAGLTGPGSLAEMTGQASSAGGYVPPFSSGSITGAGGMTGVSSGMLDSIGGMTGLDTSGIANAIGGAGLVGAGAAGGGFLSDVASKLGLQDASVASVAGALGLSPSSLTGLLGSAGQLAGGYLQGQQAQDAAKTAADAQIEAAKIAAEAARFKPVGVTTRFGSSKFGFDDKGNLTSAGYDLSPDMKAQQDALMGMLPGLMSQYQGAQAATAPMGQAAQSLFGQGTTGLQRGTDLLNQAEQWRPDVAQLKQQYAPMEAASQLQFSQGALNAQQGADLMGQANQWRPDIAQLKQQYAPMQTASQGLFGQGALNAQRGAGMLDQAEQWRPDVAQLRSQFAPMGEAGQRAMQLGQGYLAGSPQEQAAKYMAEQQAILSPNREREYAALENRLRQQGRLGLATGGTSSGMGAANPEIEALMNARRQQDLQLAGQATQGGMDYAKFGQQMVGSGGDLYRQMYGDMASAYDPYKQALGIGQDMSAFGSQQTTQGGQMLQDMYRGQAAAYDPYKQAMGIGMDLSKFGASQTTQGGQTLQDMYRGQAAAYDPYKQAMGIGMDYSKFGAGQAGLGGNMLRDMYSTQTAAYAPWQQAMGGAQYLESLGQNAMDLGTSIGAKSSTAAANAGQYLANGMTNAAQTMQGANAYSPWGTILSQGGNMLSQYGQPQAGQQMMFNPYTGKPLV